MLFAAATNIFAAQITNLRFSDFKSDSLQLDWNDPNGNCCYQVVLSSVPGFAINVASGSTEVNLRTTYYYGLQANTSYTFMVKASSESDPSYISTSAYTLWRAPAFSSFASYASSVTVDILTNGGTYYDVQASSDNFATVAASSQGAATTLIVSPLFPNTSYQISVQSLNWEFRGSTRTLVTSLLTPPTAPIFTVFTSSEVSASSITINWNRNGNNLTPPTSYQIEVATSSDFGGVIRTTVTFILSATDTGLSPSTSYYFRARAYGASASSSAYSAMISTYTKPASPIASSIQVFTTSITVNLSKNGNDAGTRYTLLATSNSFNTVYSSTSLNDYGLNVPTMTLLNLEPNTTYQIATLATAFNNLTSTRTILSSTSTLAFVPGPISVIGIGGTTITVSWQNNGNPALTPPTSYQVQISTWNGFVGTMTSSTTFATQSSTAGLAVNTTYYFRVRAFGRSGDVTAYSAVVSTLTGFESPIVMGFSIYSTSATVMLSRNGNPVGTNFAISTGNFTADNSSAGAADVGVTALTLNNLMPNTFYILLARAFNITPSSATLVASTLTLAAVPTVNSFQLFDTSAVVVLNNNGNSSGTGIAISTGIQGVYAAFNSSVAVISTFTPTTALTLSRLSGNTTYTFQAGTWDSSLRAATQTALISLSTITLAAMPTVFIFSQGDVWASSIAISWINVNSLTPPTSYQVQIATSSDFIGSVTSSETFAVPVTTAGLSANTTYFFRAKAFGRGGDITSFGAVGSTATLGNSPGHFGFQIFSTSVTVFPSPSGNPSGTIFRVQASTDNFATISASSAGLSSGITASNLTPNATYQISLETLNFSFSLSSRTIIASTYTLPAVPLVFSTFTASDVSSTSVILTWGSNDNALAPPTSYQIYISTDIGFGVFSTTDTFLTSATIPSLLPNVSYYFRTRAYGRGLEISGFNLYIATYTRTAAPICDYSVYSTSITVYISTAGNAPGTRYILEASTNNFTSIFHTYIPFFRSRGAFASSAAFSGSDGTLPSLTLSNLTANRLYSLRILTVSFSSVTTTTLITSTYTAPTIPTFTTITQIHQLYQLSISWQSNRNCLNPSTVYEAHLSTAPDFSGFISSNVGAFSTQYGSPIPGQPPIDSDADGEATLNFDVSGLSLDTTYYARVRALGFGGIHSGFSVAVTTLTGMSAPSFPGFSGGSGIGAQGLQVFATSVTVVLTRNGNPVGTQFELCANRRINENPTAINDIYTDDNTCMTAPAQAGLTTITISTGIYPNRTYRILAAARILTLSSSTLVASTVTLSLPPTTYSIQVTSNSATGWIFPHNNFPYSNFYDTVLAFSTGTDAHFNVLNSSIGIVGSTGVPVTTLKIPNLLGNTTYSLQAVTRDRSTGAIGQHFIATLTTVTLAAMPGPNVIVSTEIGSSSITLRWDNNTNSLNPPTSYQVLLSTWDPNFSNAVSSETFSIQLTTAGISPNSRYFFKVRAFGRAANDVTLYNSSVAVYSRPNSPGLISYDASPTSVTVHLAANNNPVDTLFRVQASTDNFATVSASNEGSCRNTETLISLINLNGNSTYQISLDAVNFDGLPSSRTLVSVLQTIAVVPSTPTAGEPDVRTDSITVSWNSNGNSLAPATTYQLQISTSLNFTGTVTSSQTTNLFASTITLAPNAAYHFRVRAFGQGGYISAYSGVFSTFTRAAAPGVAGFQTYIDSITVQVSDNRNPPGTLYRIIASSAGTTGADVSTAAVSNGFGSSATLAGLQPNTTYTLRADAFNVNGLVSTFTVLAATSTLMKVPGDSSFIGVDGTSITLSWLPNGNPLTPPTSYQVQVSTWAGFTGTVTSSITFALQSSTAGLLTDTFYYFRVLAFGRGGDSSVYNNVISTLTGLNAPALVNFQIFATSASAVVVRNGNPVGTILSMSTGNFKAENTVFEPATVGFTTLTLLNLTPNADYTFYAKSQNVTFSSPTFVASTTTLATPPLLATFQIFSTSISVSLGDNGNSSGTAIMISTGTDGFFGSSQSSVSFITASTTTIILSNLLGNTTFALQAGSRDHSPRASTQTIPITLSTITLVSQPTSFMLTASDVGLSSVSFTWLNTNSLTPPTSYQFQVSTSPAFTGITSDSETYVVLASSIGLSYNTTYYFRTKAFGRGGDTTPYSAAFATSTLSSSPGISGFQIYSNSATITLSHNGNAAKTVYRVEASSDGFSTVAFSSQGAQLTLTPSGLQSNTTYQIGVYSLNFNNLPSSRTLVTSTVTLASIPGAISFNSVQGTSITITWLPNGNQLTPPTSYQAQISTSSDFVVATASNTFLTQAIFAGLNAASTYFFRTAAYGRGGDVSGYNTFVTTRTRPIPLTVSGFQVYTSSISVTLSPGSNPVGVTLSITSASFVVDDTSSAINNASNVTLVLSGLVPNKAYAFLARAVGLNGVPGGTTLIASTATLPASADPLAFSFVGQSSITVSWPSNGNPLTPPTSYQVQVSSAQTSSFASYTTSDTFVLSMTSAALFPSTTYFFRVLSYGIGGTNVLSSVISSVTTPLTPPATAQNFAHSNLAITSMTFSWSDSDNETGYNILSATGPLLGTAAQNATSFILTGLSPNQLVRAKLIAFNTAGTSTNSVTLTSYTWCYTPASLSFAAADLTHITLSWSANGNPSSAIYELNQSTDNFSAASTAVIPFAASYVSVSTTISGLATGFTYQYRVRARNSDAVPTGYNTSVAFSILQSSGGTTGAGPTNVTIEPGVTVLTALLSDGRTMQILVSTSNALVSYGNGMAFRMQPGMQATCFPTSTGLVVTSTLGVTVSAGGFSLDAGSGTATLNLTAAAFSCGIATDSVQDLRVLFPSGGTRALEVSLNPLSGEIKSTLPARTFAEDVSIRFKVPDAFPSSSGFGSPVFADPSPETLSAPFGTSSLITSSQIGLEVTPDKILDPRELVTIRMTYRDSDLQGNKPEQLALCRYEPTVQKWLTLTSPTLNKAAKTAAAMTKHFSTFQLMLVTPASDVNGLRVFPNPLQIHQGDTEMVFSNLSAQASIKIYTYSGELVRELKAGDTGIVRWDARNASGDSVSTGIYIALVEGGLDSKKIIKIGVEK